MYTFEKIDFFFKSIFYGSFWILFLESDDRNRAIETLLHEGTEKVKTEVSMNYRKTSNKARPLIRPKF